MDMIRNRPVLAGLSAIFQLLPDAVFDDNFVRLSGADRGKARQINCSVKILQDAHLYLAGEVLHLQLRLERIVGGLNPPALEVQPGGVADGKLLLA